MESKRAPASSPESTSGFPDAAPKHVTVDADAKTSKSKKTSLPAGAILNTQLHTESKDVSTDTPKSEKDGWNIESLLGGHEQKTTPEEDQNPEPLTDDEAREVIQDYIEDRSEAVDAELSDTEEESPLAEIVSANQVLLDKLREQVTAGEKPADAIIEEATQSTIQELRLEQGGSNDNEEPLHRTPEEPLRTTVRRKEAAIASILTEEAPEDTDELATAVGPPPPTPPSRTEFGMSDDSTPESSGSTDSTSETPMPFSDDLAREVYAAHSSHEAQPVATPSTSPERTESPGFTRGDVARGVLVGGVAGYMIGRHSGRKRAEAKARPVHAEMTKEIASLQQKIAQNEQIVRSLAAQKTARSQAEKTKPQPAFDGEKLNAGWPSPAKKAEAPTKKSTPHESLAKPLNTNEASAMPLATAATHEKTAFNRTFNNNESSSRPRIQPSQEQVRAVRPIEKLPIEDVLVLAKAVKIEGKTLDTYYKQGQLTETDVRKILIEHRRTGRPERAFYRQINAHEHQRSYDTPEKNKPASRELHRTSSASDARQQMPDTTKAENSASQTFTEAIREVHPVSTDKIHADNTPRVGMIVTVGIVILIIFAFFLTRIILR